jgi:formylglycine-generating enzyme required for sulfatase activity
MGSTATSYAADVALSDDGYCLVADEDDGLLVLGGRGPFRDETAPGRVSDLAVDPTAVDAVDLTWTMTGDDGLHGMASSLDLRWSADPITSDDDWEAANPVADLPPVEMPGTSMQVTVDGFERNQTYHFAVRVGDTEGHTSPMSNAASGATLDAIMLRQGGVDPSAGSGVDVFTFVVEVLWGLEVSAAEVIIDGIAHAMTPAEGRYYHYQTTLPGGLHDYSFRVTADSSPTALFPADGSALSGPAVGEVFTMGSPLGENGRNDDEPLHEVALSNGVIAGTHEVTQAEWTAVMDAGTHPNPSQHPGDERPVDSVDWHGAVAYCNARSLADGLTPAYTITGQQVTWDRGADGWRLPTEAEWEYLCRAGTTTALPSGDLEELECRLDANLDAVGWYCGNGAVAPAVGGQKQANAFGLYDMNGNLREWCWDWYGPLGEAAALDPAGPETGLERVCRGGSWYVTSQACRSAARAALPPDSADDTVGFRVVRTDFQD